MNEPTCEMCNTSLKGKVSIDIWVLTTTYDETGDFIKTSLPAPDGIKPDYLVIGLECCGHLVPGYWKRLLHGLGYE